MDLHSSSFIGVIIDGLKSKSEEDRFRTVIDLFRIVDRELKEVSVQGYVFCLDKICIELLNMYSTGELWEKKAAVQAMACLTEVDFASIQSHCRQFATLLLNHTAANDIQLITEEARLLGQFCAVSQYDFVDECVKRLCEILTSDQQDAQKQFSILVLRELASNMPTTFYQYCGLFFKAILNAFREKNVITRELASLALGAALSVAAAHEQRYPQHPGVESHVTGPYFGASSTFSHPTTHQDLHSTPASPPSALNWYRNCLTEALRPYGEIPAASASSLKVAQLKKLNRDDWIHGSLLLLNELMISVLPNHEELLRELDEMSGLSLFDYLTVQNTEASQAVKIVVTSRWAFYDGSVAGFCDLLSSLPNIPHPTESSSSSHSREALTDPKAPVAISTLCQRILLENIDGICHTVLTWMKSRSPNTTHLLLRSLPRLVALRSLPSGDHEPHQTIVNWLIQCVHKEREKPMALISLALVGYHIGPEFLALGWLSQLFSLIRSILVLPKDASLKKRSIPLETAAILSVGVLVKALGSTLYEPIKQLLENLVAVGLNQSLVATLRVIANHVPQLNKEVKDQILRDISLVLMPNTGSNLGRSQSVIPVGGAAATNFLSMSTVNNLLNNMSIQTTTKTTTSAGHPGILPQTHHPGAAATGSSISSGGLRLSRLIHNTTGKFHTLRPTSCAVSCTSPTANQHTVSASGALISQEVPAEVAVIALALRVLGSFTFEGRSLVHFVRHISRHFLCISACEVKVIRMEAVKTCARLMLPWLNSVESHDWLARSALHTVIDCLNKLLAVGINDPDPDVRRCVFESLDSGFDQYLAQAEHLSSLFLALYDEVFDIRCLVMRRLGRLAEINPAYVHPALRKVLLHTISELAYSGSVKNKEQSALLLACMITAAPRFFIPYAEHVLELLVPRIRHAIPASWQSLLCRTKAVGEDFQSTGGFSLKQSSGKPKDPVQLGGTLGSPAWTTGADRMNSVLPRHPGSMLSVLAPDAVQTTSTPGTTNHLQLQSDISNQWMEPTSVVVALFTTLGRLSAVAPLGARSYMDEFIPVLCRMMTDQSCYPRRLVAVWTLSTMISNTGYVVEPYRRHPQLLSTLLDVLKREESKRVRLEVLRALGVLGALDPFNCKLYTGQLDTVADTGIAVSLHEPEERKDVDVAQSELVVHLSWENRNVFFSVCALSSLIRLLRDPSLCSQHGNVMKTVVLVLEQLGQRSTHYLRQLMPDYFACLQMARDNRVQEHLIRHLGSIMNIVGLHTKEFAKDAIDALIAHWWVAPNVQNACIRVLSSMATVLRAEFRPHLTRLVPLMLRTLHHESSEANLITLLEILPQFGYSLEDHMHILVPAIAGLIGIGSDASLYALISSAVELNKSTSTDSTSNPDATSSRSMLDDLMERYPLPPSSASFTPGSVSLHGYLVVGSIKLRICALECLARLTDLVDLEDLAGQIVQPICRLLMALGSCTQHLQHMAQQPHTIQSVLPSSSSSKTVLAQVTQASANVIQILLPAAIDVLTGLLHQMGQKFRLLLPLVEKTLNHLHIHPTRFYTVLGLIEKGAYLPTSSDRPLSRITTLATQAESERVALRETDPASAVQLYDTRGMNLERAWRSPPLMSRDDLDQWLKTLTATLLRESPNPSIRACSHLLSATSAIGRSLFNAAFVSCWPELTPAQQDTLISKLEEVLYLTDQSPEVSQAILNLEEFMAHVDRCSNTAARVPLPLSLRLLSDRAMKNRAYAKALYYKEQEFLEELEKRSSPSQETLSCLLTIYSKLHLEEAAAGVLIYATRNPQDKLRNEEVWREKLHDWKSALNLYENKLKDERIRDKSDLLLGRMRCLRALGQWSPLNTAVSKHWDKLDPFTQTSMAPIACDAAWAMREWSSVERYVSALPTEQSFDGSFYRAVLDIHHERYPSALQHITKARCVLDADLTTMAAESYDRAYNDLVCTQLLSEAEEVIQYKLIPERRPVLREAWRSRLHGCQSVVEDWSQIIKLRSLVLQPREDSKSWLRFAGLCCRDGRFDLARQVIYDLLEQDPARTPQNEPIPNADPATVFAYAKLLWATGANEEAVTRLCVLVTHVLEPLIGSDTPIAALPRPSPFDMSETLDNLDLRNPTALVNSERVELKSLMAECCLHLGSWYSDLYIRNPPGSAIGQSQSHGTNHTGLHTYVSTTTRLFRDRVPSARSIMPGSDRSPTHFRAGTRSISSSDNESNQRRSRPVSEGVGVNVPQAWEERQGFVIQCYDKATKHAPENRLAWQSWAMTNYAVFNHLDALKARIENAELELKAGSHPPLSPNSNSAGSNNTGPLSPSAQTLADLWHAKVDLQLCMELHAAPSVRGFINSISLSPSANLQDSLRLINLFFKFGHLAEIREVIREGLAKIRLSNWLLVIQQLLARIDTPRDYVASIIVDLLIAVGKSYPQALVYPLVLAFKSGGSDRRRHNANRILYNMEEHSPRLVSEAFLLNEELIRLSITWVEMWCEALEDASRVYFGEKNITKMFRILHPFHQMMERGQETIHEAAFLQDHGSELANCRSRCENYEQTSNKIVLQQAWEGYYSLYRQFTKQVNSMSSLELSVASPRLYEYRNDWEIAVPGSYEPNRPLVRVSGIKNCLSLMTSKQHPRKLTVLGSDGHQYMFLLKGHEDTRQDERVMQFFGLVNTLLTDNPESLRRNLTIQRMSVIPLSTNTGLIGWVPNTDTMHSLIRDYREKTQTVLNKENREMIALAPDFERLNVIQKTEIFEAGLRESSGRDLANILWLKSHSSEAWFERRTNFVRSMATMSMVGYILGLGDRHPSNILLSRETGKVVHIDFGDCFEVATMREKFPEKVPFRLTRMIIAAMEVTGIDGVYRQTCEMVMSLMRTNRESLLAVLEAFIHDPLLQWVILETRKDFVHVEMKLDDQQGQQTAAAAAAAMNAAQGPIVIGADHNAIGPQQQQPAKLGHRPTQMVDAVHARQHQNHVPHGALPTRRPAAVGLNQHNIAQPPHPCEHHPQQASHKRTVSPKHVFINPNHPESSSLRDPLKINPWRHHLCNGPWFGCYETAKRLRRQTETGHIIVERQGLQGFIFSAKPSNDDEPGTDPDVSTKSATSTGNTKARAVMEKIRHKLNGTEREEQMDVSHQVNFLIREASSNQNLCQMYIGWCAFW